MMKNVLFWPIQDLPSGSNRMFQGDPNYKDFFSAWDNSDAVEWYFDEREQVNIMKVKKSYNFGETFRVDPGIYKIVFKNNSK